MGNWTNGSSLLVSLGLPVRESQESRDALSGRDAFEQWVLYGHRAYMSSRGKLLLFSGKFHCIHGYQHGLMSNSSFHGMVNAEADEKNLPGERKAHQETIHRIDDVS